MNVDENGNVTIKCNKHYSTDKHKCYNSGNSLCPFRGIFSLVKDDNNCKNGIVTLNWIDYISFNNYMTQEFEEDK